jgi:hypothetical protein
MGGIRQKKGSSQVTGVAWQIMETFYYWVFLGFGFGFGSRQRGRAKTNFSVAPRYSLGEKLVFARPLEL